LSSALRRVGAFHINPANYKTFAPNDGRHPSRRGHYLFAISGSTPSRPPLRNKKIAAEQPIGILGGLAICTLDLCHRRAVRPIVPYSTEGGRSAFTRAELPICKRELDVDLALRLAHRRAARVSYGQRGILFAMARDGCCRAGPPRFHPRFRKPHITTVVTGLCVGAGALYFDGTKSTI